MDYATYDRKRNINSSYRSNKNDRKHVNNKIAGTKSTSQLQLCRCNNNQNKPYQLKSSLILASLAEALTALFQRRWTSGCGSKLCVPIRRSPNSPPTSAVAWALVEDMRSFCWWHSWEMVKSTVFISLTLFELCIGENVENKSLNDPDIIHTTNHVINWVRCKQTAKCQ